MATSAPTDLTSDPLLSLHQLAGKEGFLNLFLNKLQHAIFDKVFVPTAAQPLVQLQQLGLCLMCDLQPPSLRSYPCLKYLQLRSRLLKSPLVQSTNYSERNCLRTLISEGQRYDLIINLNYSSSSNFNL